MAFSMDDILRAKGLPVQTGYNPGATMTGSGENAFMARNHAGDDYQPTQAYSHANAAEAYQRARSQAQQWQDQGWQTNLHGAGVASDASLGALFDPVTGMNFGSNPGGGFYGYDAALMRADKGHDNFALNGQPYFNYGQDGSFQGQGTWTGLKKDSAMDQLLPLAMMLAPIALTAAGVAGAAGGAGAAGAGGAGGAVGSGAGFVGEGALSGIGAWDGALAGASAGGAAGGAGGLGGLLKSMGSGASSLFGGGGAGGAGGAGGLGGLFGGGGSSLMGLGSTLLGALGGGQGSGGGSASSTRAMDPRMDALFYGDLAPRTQGLLGSQMGQAQNAGNQMLGVGSGLLGQTAPTTATNPYLKSIADDMQRRTMEMLGQNNLAIQGNAVGTGGLGGSRQGVAQGIAAGQATDSLQGNVAGLYGNAYNQDQNRLRQDWTIGSGLMNQGLQTPWAPIQNTSQAYSPFTGFGTTTNSQDSSGGGWQGALGGALTGASLGRQMGWW